MNFLRSSYYSEPKIGTMKGPVLTSRIKKIQKISAAVDTAEQP